MSANLPITWITRLLPVVLLALVNGCSGLEPELLNEVNKAPKDFLLGPEDVLEVTVWRNQELSRQVVVRPDGLISLPLIGDVKATGMSAAQLAEVISARLKEYKENPTVTVSVKEVNSYYVYVMGEVMKPGKLQLKSHATVLQAIAMAGGFTQYASRNKIRVLRVSKNGQGEPHEMRIPLHYDDVVAGKGEVTNFVLKSGDTIVVP
jgi:polysaccharide export outer membrane protein